MPHKFGRDVRLRSHAQFQAVSDHGRRVTARYMTLLGRPNVLGRDRLGIIASRRIGGAVVRNRAKRRIREVFRRQMAGADAGPQPRPLDLVVIARRELVGAAFTVVATDFQTALRKLRGAE
jgi:ribonuclease P protein component